MEPVPVIAVGGIDGDPGRVLGSKSLGSLGTARVNLEGQRSGCGKHLEQKREPGAETPH